MAPYFGGPQGRLHVFSSALVVACLLGCASGASAQTVRGVTDTEIVIGTIADLSGLGAPQGVNNTAAIRMVFDDANTKGGVHGRKIRYIVEDSQLSVTRAVQAINKLINSDNIFIALATAFTPINDAIMPVQFAKNVPNIFPAIAARSTYEPYNHLKFAQFASYYDQTRSAVKFFVEQRGRKAFCGMYQDVGMGTEVAAGVVAQTEAMGIKVVATTMHKATDTDFNAPVVKLKEAGCDVVMLATGVRDTNLIIQTMRRIGMNVDLVGQFVAYDLAVAGLPGGVAEGFFCMAPGLYAYPDDPRPAVQAFAKEYIRRYGRDPNFYGEAGYTAANIVLMALDKAGKNLTVESFIEAMESIHDYKDIFGYELSFGPDQHHGSTKSFLSVVQNGRWVPVTQQALSY
jgi:branched-chain amino acid transport system substrate-binding protein